jgi:DNA/RNA endonuclease YhcR with UshA esterase domain
MKQRFPMWGPFALLALSLFAAPIQAQTTEARPQSPVHKLYDITQEVTITGTVTNVVKAPTREMKMAGGSHILLETKSGTIDASLGRYALRGEGALAVKAGDRVQITGVMKTVKDKPVLVTRLVNANGHVFALRNKNGFILLPMARKVNNAGTNGGQL